MNRFFAIVAASAVFSSPAWTEEAGEWTPLLKDDLSGWVNVNCAPETWSVKDGLVRCTGKPTGALRSPRMYENFVLECEWRHLESAGNAGIFIWGSPIAAKGVPFLRAIEVQVLDQGYGNTDTYTTHGDVFPIHGATMVPFGRSRGMRSFPSESRSKPSPEWNHYRVECNQGVLRLSVNGKEVSGGEKCNWRKGYIGLESEGSPTEWRNIRIKELPPSEAPAAETAPEALGHRPMFNGLDLRGWKTTTPERWKPDDSQLQLAAGTPGAPLWNETPLGDVEILFDVHVLKTSEREPAILLGDSADSTKALRMSLGALPPDETGKWPGKWYRATLTLKGNKATLLLDDRQIAEQTLPDGAQRFFGVEDNGGALNFTNFYLRNL